MNRDFRHVLKSSPAVIYVCQASGDYVATYVSGNMADQLGYSPEQFVGNPSFWRDNLHPDDVDRVFAELAGLFKNRHHILEYRFRAGTGEYRWMRDEARLVRNPATGEEEIVGSWLDITDRKTAEEELREAQRRLAEALETARFERDKTLAILENIGDGISIQDLELRVLYQNAAHRDRMGSHLGEFCYRAYQNRSEVCPGCHLVQSFADGKVHVRETTASPAGELRHFQIVSTPLLNSAGEVFAGIESVRDITARKQAEEILRLKSSELEQSNQELEAFSYTLSHDLRAYLARIALAGESLQQLQGARLDEEGQYFLETILATCQSMDDLIATMLTLAHISREVLQIQEIDLSVLAENICGELAKAEPGRRFSFDISPGIRVEADPHLLQVVLENLLGNACKYTKGREEARIGLHAASKADGRLLLTVSDNGIGFEMAEAERLFQPFQRLAGARAFPGFGIGLTTAQRVIHRHGGEIWAEATPGVGATFYFTLGGPSSGALTR